MAKNPILDFGLRNPQVGYMSCHYPDYRKDPSCQDELALKIVLTCRAYREQGFKMFWQRNQFQYSQSMALLTSLKRGIIWQPSSSNMMRHLILQHAIVDDHGSIIREILHTLDLCSNFESLETLTVHIVQFM